MIVPEHAGFGDTDKYKSVPDIERLKPKKGTPSTVYFKYDYDAEQAKKFRGTMPHLVSESETEPSFTSPSLFSDGRSISLLPGGKAVKVTGPTHKVREANIAFRPTSINEYSVSQDSVFRPVTKNIDREFAILPDIRPEGEFEMPSYETSIDGVEDYDYSKSWKGRSASRGMKFITSGPYSGRMVPETFHLAGPGGMGADITRLPADADFDLLDEPHHESGVVPVLEPGRAKKRRGGMGQTEAAATALQKAAGASATPAPVKDVLTTASELLTKYGPSVVDAAAKLRAAKKPIATTPPPTPTVSYQAPLTTGFWTPTNIAIIAGIGVVAVGGMVFMMTGKKKE